MKNIDVEVYIRQMITFFENNPGDFMDLVGTAQKDLFYQKMKEKSLENVEKGEDYILTKQPRVDSIELINYKKMMLLAILEDKKFETWEKLIQVDYEEADIVKALAERAEANDDLESAISYYKKGEFYYKLFIN